MNTCDVVVIGLGIVGASAVHALAGARVRVIGLDAFGPTHRYGSSHGESRIYRRAYWEGAGYLPLLNRANALWSALDDAVDEPILVRTGGIFVGSKKSGLVSRSRATAEAGGIDHATLHVPDARFPAFRWGDDAEALYEPGAYLVRADRARARMLDRAARSGAELRFGVRASAISQNGRLVTTHTGESFSCGAVIVATGPWMASQLVPEVQPFVQATRVPIYWFRARAGHESDYAPERFPVFLHEAPSGKLLYGCPWVGDDNRGAKIGFHNWQQVLGNPDVPDRTVDAALQREMADQIAELFPSLDPAPVEARICYYTISDDGNFIIGTSRDQPHVHYASACSGHGFKFAPAVGEALACLALGKEPPVSLEPYGVARYGVDFTS